MNIFKYYSVITILALTACTAPTTTVTPSITNNPSQTVTSPPQTNSEKPFPTDKEVTISGTTECLPHKAKGDVQTMECAYGIKSKETHYALKFPRDDQMFDFQTGKNATIKGHVIQTPDSIYDIVGTIQIINIVYEAQLDNTQQ